MSCSQVSSARRNSEQISMRGNLLKKVTVISDNDDTIAPSRKLSPHFNIARSLERLVMDRPVAEDADVGCVEEIRDATEFWHGPLRLVGQAEMSLGEHVQKAPF